MNRVRTAFSRVLGASVLSAGLLLGGGSCGTGGAGSANVDLGASEQSGISILSFGTNAPGVTDGELIRFVAVLTDTGGADKLVGGQLVSPDGAFKYGAFVADRQGTYSLDLPWSQLSQAQTISFATEDTRTFVAEFYNVNGQKTSKSVQVRLHCNGDPACEGRCVSPGKSCPLSTSKLCIAGACQKACYVDRKFYSVEERNSENTCQSCDPEKSTSVLQSLPAYTSCAQGLACSTGGKCEVPFVRQVLPTSRYLLDVAVPNTTLQIAVGEAGLIFRSTDGGQNWNPVASGVSESLRRVFAIDAMNLYAIGYSSTILKSTDGGATWTKQNLGVADLTLTDVWASSTADVLLTSDRGVFRSTDGGTTWSRFSELTEFRPFAIRGTSATNFYVVSSGQLARTTNGGTTFTMSSLPSNGYSRGFWVSGPSDLYLVGDFSRVYHSKDGGASWTTLLTPAKSSQYELIVDAWGTGPNNVYVVCSSGQVWRTTDGETLTVVPTVPEEGGGPSELSAIHGSGPDQFTIVASRGKVFRKR